MNNTIAVDQKEKSAQLMWTGFILLFFVVQAIIWAVAITITVRDPSHAVVAGYDEKALHWDDEKALRLASSQLGWQADIFIDTTGDIRGNRAITLKIQDKNQAPVKDASVELKAFHRARAGEPQQILLSEINDGVYTGKIEVRKDGLWQFDGVAKQGDKTYLIDQRLHLDVGK